MVIKGQLRWNDYLQAQLLHLQPIGFAKVIAYGILVFFGFAFLGSLYLAAIGQFPLVSMIPGLLFLAFIVLYRFVLLPNRVKRIFHQQKELSAPFELEITEMHLKAVNEFGSSARPWENFIKWKENKDLLILYHSDVMFSILPKRLFTNLEQIETIRGYLLKHQVPVAKNRSRASCVIYVLLFIVIVWMLYRGLAS